MHGAVDRKLASRDQYVITEDDYIDFLARMTKNKAIPAIFAEAFQTRHFLFLGYSLRDWNLRVILHRIWGEQKLSWRSWAIQRQPSRIEQEFWSRRGVEILDLLLEDYVAGLCGKLQSSPAGGSSPAPVLAAAGT